MLEKIEIILSEFQRFGVNLGLTRIVNLLNLLGNPQEKVPIIHVAGTNGKGSVCAYLSSILAQSGHKTGRYTSPHLINWNERICLNEQPISEVVLLKILEKIRDVVNPNEPECPTQFEVITAAAWLFFAESNVDVAVMEVGLGGRLDATNVCKTNLVSIITSISRDHWQRLGDTIEEIAGEKAGVIKAGCPVIIGQLPPSAQGVIMEKIRDLNCPYQSVKPAQKIVKNGISYGDYQGIIYPLPLMGDIQLQNSALAITTIKLLQEKGWNIDISGIERGMSKARWRGRIEWVSWQGHQLLIDGAHNEASAKVLREYVETLGKPVIWIMGMLATKDHQGILSNLVRSHDQLYLVPVPDHATASVEYLSELAVKCQPDLTKVNTYHDVYSALEEAVKEFNPEKEVIVMCGSLYLIGSFLKTLDTEKP